MNQDDKTNLTNNNNTTTDPTTQNTPTQQDLGGGSILNTNLGQTLPPLPDAEREPESSVAKDQPIDNINQVKNMENQPNTDLASNLSPNEKKSKEKIVERVIVKEKTPRGGFLGSGCGCRTLSCMGCFGLLAIIVALAALVIIKPTNIWDKTVNLLNGNLDIPEFNGTTYESAVSSVNSQVEEVGENTIILNEDELTAFGRENIPQLKDLSIDIEENYLRLYWNLDKTISDNPLVGVIEFRKNDSGELVIRKLGTNRVSTPAFLNDYITDIVLTVLNLGSENKDNKNAFISRLIALSESVEIKDIYFEEDQMKLQAYVNVNLFN